MTGSMVLMGERIKLDNGFLVSPMTARQRKAALSELQREQSSPSPLEHKVRFLNSFLLALERPLAPAGPVAINQPTQRTLADTIADFKAKLAASESGRQVVKGGVNVTNTGSGTGTIAESEKPGPPIREVSKGSVSQ